MTNVVQLYKSHEQAILITPGILRHSTWGDRINHETVLRKEIKMESPILLLGVSVRARKLTQPVKTLATQLNYLRHTHQMNE